MSEIMKCPMCENDMEMEPWRWPECTKCPFSCAISDLPRITAAMELAKTASVTSDKNIIKPRVAKVIEVFK